MRVVIKHAWRTRSILAVVAVVLAATWPAHGQVELLDVKDGSGADSGQSNPPPATPRKHSRKSRAQSTPATAGQTGGTIDTTLPALQYTWSRTTGILARGKYFDVALDSPAFSNFEYRSKGQTEWTEGACFGINVLAVLWLKKIVIPILDQSFLRYIFSSQGKSLTDVEVANTLSIPGPIRMDNIEDFRLRSYSAGKAQDVARAAVKLMSFQGASDTRPQSYASVKAFTDEVVSEVEDSDDEVAMLDLYTQIGEGAHSLIIYRVEKGFAKPVGGGDEVAAIRFLMFDPNLANLVPKRTSPGEPGGSTVRSPYLMAFPDADKVAIAPDYLKNYDVSASPAGVPSDGSGTGGGGDHANYFQDGTYYTGTLRLHPIHDSRVMSDTDSMRIKIGGYEMTQPVADVTPDNVDLKMDQ